MPKKNTYGSRCKNHKRSGKLLTDERQPITAITEEWIDSLMLEKERETAD